MKDVKRFLWMTDLHLDMVYPWTKLKFLADLAREKPAGIFLTGDIANGLTVQYELELMARIVDCPIYFTLGNHDLYFSSFQDVHSKLLQSCAKYSNLKWLTVENPIKLSKEVAIIGTDGWSDAQIGNPSYLKFTPDWFLIKEFRQLSSMKQRVEYYRWLAQKSANQIEYKLELALEENFKTIYIFTHFPPWKEATRDVGTFFEKFWLPYNVNCVLGEAIEKVMKKRKKRRVVICAGHSHCPEYIRISRNIDCQVGRATSTFSKIVNYNLIYV